MGKHSKEEPKKVEGITIGGWKIINESNHVRIIPEGTPEESVLRKDDYYEEESCVPDEIDSHFCLHCGKGIPIYCEKCYQLLTCKNTSLQIQLNSSFPKNTVLEFMDSLRAILISGEADEIKNKNIMNLYIQYIEELRN